MSRSGSELGCKPASSPDTLPKVIHPPARRAPAHSSPQPAVNNFAEPNVNCAETILRPRHASSGRIALDGSRSSSPDPARITPSSPARLAAPVQTSERTIAREAPGIRSTRDGATMHRKKAYPMKEWKEITHYAGFDWARDHHAVVVINADGQIVSDFEFDHTQEGWKSFLEKTAPYPNLAIAIETNQGAALDQLLQREFTVYPVNPVASESYRNREAVSAAN